MIRSLVIILSLFLVMPGAFGQNLEKPNTPTPSLKKVKRTHYRHSHSYGGSGLAGSMGLFDWNFTLGYIDKLAHETFAGAAPPADLSTSGQYLMFQLQEGLLSNYMLAKKRKRNKRIKFGFQDTFDLGFMRGPATDKSSDFTTNNTAPFANKVSGFFNYQAGLAIVVRASKYVDLGYTYYPYVHSVFSPNVRNYSKLRMRLGPLMGEYSFNGKNQIEVKYLRGTKLYIGLSYNKTSQNYMNPLSGTSNVNTNWFHLSLGRVF